MGTTSGKDGEKAAGRQKGTCALVTLGCPKNLVDSERMLGLLGADGYRLVTEADGADFVIVNTCGFLASAREESLGVIREMLDKKREGRVGGVIVAGCLAQREGESLQQEYPEIDQVVGVFSRDDIVSSADLLKSGLNGRRKFLKPEPSKALPDTGRLRLTAPHVAYLKVAEGCNRVCTFCTIPSIRGKFISKPIEEIVAEARELAADGVRELVIVAQDTSYYGRDIYGRPRLADLLVELEEVDGLEWIRLMYLYPRFITDELVDRLAAGGKVLPYLDMPLQHASDEVLRRMKRQVSLAQTEELLDRLRSRVDRLVLRTTMITGFPGETEGQFEELLEFVRRWHFERLGAFAYSFEPGTPSAELDGHLPDEVKQARRGRLMEEQQKIAFAYNEAQVGNRLQVLIDRDIPGEKDAFVGRSHADAPEVDCVVYVTGAGLAPGQIVDCEIVTTKGYDLIGAAVSQPR